MGGPRWHPYGRLLGHAGGHLVQLHGKGGVHYAMSEASALYMPPTGVAVADVMPMSETQPCCEVREE